jgi:hypothetical protein
LKNNIHFNFFKKKKSNYLVLTKKKKNKTLKKLYIKKLSFFLFLKNYLYEEYNFNNFKTFYFILKIKDLKKKIKSIIKENINKKIYFFLKKINNKCLNNKYF